MDIAILLFAIIIIAFLVQVMFYKADEILEKMKDKKRKRKLMQKERGLK